MHNYNAYHSGQSHMHQSQPSSPAGQGGGGTYQNRAYYQQPDGFYQSPQLWKGVALGAIAAVFLTNESLQKSVMKGAIKIYDTVLSGAYGLKEKFEDVQAEIHQEPAE